MHILSIRPEAGPVPRARFDVEVAPDLRLYNLLLREVGSGRYRTYAPNAHGKHAVSFHPNLAEKITTAAVAALKERAADGAYSEIV
jgi:hypothetical protein